MGPTKQLKLVVVGGSQGTGKATVEEALSRGHQVVAVARTPANLKLEHPKLSRIAADVVEPKTLAGVFDGADAVVIALGATLKAMKTDPTLMSRGTLNVLAEMKKAGVKKVVVLSSDGTGDSRGHFPWLMRWLVIDGILKRAFADHDRQEGLVRASGLAWVIARPSRLGNGPAKHAYRKTTDLAKVPTQISRADTAHFMLEAVERDEWNGKAVCLGG